MDNTIQLNYASGKYDLRLDQIFRSHHVSIKLFATQAQLLTYSTSIYSFVLFSVRSEGQKQFCCHYDSF